MQLMCATCKLGIVTAKAVMKQHIKGDVEEAQAAAAEALDEYDKFVKTLAGKQASKI